MGYIYIVRNDVNQKVYIGQTIRTTEIRWSQHKTDAKNGSNLHFHQAIRKYGEEHFHISVIEECPNELLNEREKYWISFFDSYNNGYNSTLGGDGFQKYTITTEEVGKLWDTGLSITEIANQYGLSRTAIKNRLQSYENYSKDKSIKQGIQNAKISKFQPVYQWSDVGDFITRFTSGMEVEEKTGFNRKAISSAIINKTLSNGYYWTHGEKPVCKNRIAQYDMQGNFIKYWKDAATASRALGCDSSGILKCCRGTRKSCCNFIWRKE